MRVDESWRSNASKSCNSHQLSSSFDRALSRYSLGCTKKVLRFCKKDTFCNTSIVCAGNWFHFAFSVFISLESAGIRLRTEEKKIFIMFFMLLDNLI